ncbi:hypothetical protein AAG747_01850 [Rapidithrix thailandica]|uniref:Uncharacterized protein n=1 Tax=Rapidithrix thailandica TaxID=413964 RepID=A0AAW9S0B6_9BACT
MKDTTTSRKLWFCVYIVSFGLAMLQGCNFDKEDFNFDQAKFEEISPTLALPLFSSQLNYSHLINSVDQDFLDSEKDGLLSFMYTDTLMGPSLNSFTQLSNIRHEFSLEFTEIPLPLSISKKYAKLADFAANTGLKDNVKPFPPFKIDNIEPFQFPEIENLNYARFQQGKISLEVINMFDAMVNLSFEVRNAEGVLIGTPINLSNLEDNGGKETVNLDLAGMTITKEMQVIITELSSPGNPHGRLEYIDGIFFKASYLDLAVEEVELILEEPLEVHSEEILPLAVSFEIYEAFLEKGTLNLQVESDLTNAVTLDVSFPGIHLEGTPLQFSSQLSKSQEISIDKASLDLTQTNTGYNELLVQTTTSLPVTGQTIRLTNHEKIQCQITLKELNISSVKGYFGQFNGNLPNKTVDIGIFQNTLTNGQFNLKDFSIDFAIYNQYGFPIDLTLDQLELEREEDRSKLPLQVNESTIHVPAASNYLSTEVVEDIHITNTSEILPFKPTKLNYGGTMHINPHGKSVNFLTDTSNVYITATTKVPLYGSLTSIQFQDTVEIGLEINTSDLGVGNASLKTKVENEFPLAMKVQFYFVDSENQVTDSLYREGAQLLVESAKTDVNGVTIENFVKADETDLEEEQLLHLLNAQKIVIAAELASEGGGAKDVKILDHYELKVKMGILSNLKITINHDE